MASRPALAEEKVESVGVVVLYGECLTFSPRVMSSRDHRSKSRVRKSDGTRIPFLGVASCKSTR